MINKKEYFFKNANQFGWGPKTAKLKTERIKVLDKYVRGKKILDVGCGTGVYTDYLTKKGLDVTGIDFVKKFIDYAKKNYQGKFLTANIYKLPFLDKSFDTVYMFDVLEHLKDEMKALKELRRIVRKRIILFVPKETDKRLESIGLIYKHYLDRTHERTYTKSRIKSILFKSNFKKIKIIPKNKIHNETFINNLILGNSFLKKLIIKLILRLFNFVDYYLDLFVLGEV